MYLLFHSDKIYEKFRRWYAGNKDVVQLRECPLCPPHKNDMTNLWTLGIFTDNGAWNCFRCGNHGNWSTLIRIFNLYGSQQNDYFAFNDNYDDLYNNYNTNKNIDFLSLLTSSSNPNNPDSFITGYCPNCLIPFETHLVLYLVAMNLLFLN